MANENRVSVLGSGPIPPTFLSTGAHANETERQSRRRTRFVMSSYETIRATGTGVARLSPWGDSSPLLLPCIRYRDVITHIVHSVTGGLVFIAYPADLDIVIEGVVSDSLVIDSGRNRNDGFQHLLKSINDLLKKKPSVGVQHSIHSTQLETSQVKNLTMKVTYQHVVTNAALGYFRSSIHNDPKSFFGSLKSYLAVEKGWFSPYLFASGRRPIIPRYKKADVAFCTGPFLGGDYRVGQTLLEESALVITLCDPPPPMAEPPSPRSPQSASTLSLSTPRTPRRLVILLVGLKPYRIMWSTSARPGESVIKYRLCNGCPAIVVPARAEAPLLAWSTLTLEQLWRLELPAEDEPQAQHATAPSTNARSHFEGVVAALCEYVEFCVDWERV
ncbi:hypothetical protein H0H93_011245, partial [Arthromyces matolae]